MGESRCEAQRKNKSVFPNFNSSPPVQRGPLPSIADRASKPFGWTFKPAPGGWVFKSGRRGPRYFLTDAQKAEILAALKPRRPDIWQAVYWTANLLWFGAIMGTGWALRGHTILGPGVLFAAMVIFYIVSLVAAQIIFVVGWQRRQMRPILARLGPMDE